MQAVRPDTRPADRIRLVEFLAAFGIGGTERHVVNLSRALDPERFALSFACLRRWGDLLGEVEAVRMPVEEYRVGSLYPHRMVPGQLRFARGLRKGRVQIVHAYNVYANIFAVPPARLAGTPVVVASIRDTGIYLTPLQKRVQRLACRLADCVLVNADAVRRWLEDQGYPADRLVVIRNGVDLSRFTLRPGDGALRRELGLPADAPIILVLSRLDRNKGIDEFLEAAAVVAARTPRARFLVAGDRFVARDGAIVRDAQRRDELQRRVRDRGLAGRVVFTGFRLDVPALLAEAAISVLPSRSEGLSNAVLESMAAGVPVVATRVGGIPEAVEDGVSGLLVPPRDPDALARAMQVLLEHGELARRLGGEARRRVEERFSLERMVRETEALYVTMLERSLAARAARGPWRLRRGGAAGRV